jgi:hypothetical protein
MDWRTHGRSTPATRTPVMGAGATTSETFATMGGGEILRCTLQSNAEASLLLSQKLDSAGALLRGGRYRHVRVSG